MSELKKVVDDSSQQFVNPRAQYKLSFNDYNLLVSFVKDVRALDLHIANEDDIENIQKFCNLCYKYFPNCKIHKLSFKENAIQDGIAYAAKMDDNKPELYALILDNNIAIIDQYKCEMYNDDAPFIKPDWTKIKYYKEIINNE